MNNLRIAYCGPIAAAGLPARGGYEAANRRLIDDLRACGAFVKEYPYAPERTTLAGKTVAYATNFAALAGRMLAEAGGWDILHITPLRRHFTMAEAVVCMNAKARGRKLVVDIRAGNFIRDMADTASPRVKVMRYLLRLADLVAVEGSAYVDFAQLLTPAPVHYLPNYVSSPADLTPAANLRPGEPVRLVFLARIVREKGIEVAIEALRALLTRGVNARLEVLGRGAPAYVERLKAETADVPVIWRGAVAAEAVCETIRGAHFFIFPTTHGGEGHSNALTEAMSERLVPLCADNGFNASVVADCGHIFSRNASGADYADAIEGIVAGGYWAEWANCVRARVDDTFTAAAVVPPLIDAYRRLLAPAVPIAAE